MLLNDDGSYTSKNNSIFRDLTVEEVVEFKKAARKDHKPPFPVISKGWHPVYREECRIIESEMEAF